MLADGTYDVFVVDATAVDDDGAPAGSWLLELTIVAGEHTGELVALGASGLAGTDIDLLGMPGTLVVADGQPRFTVDA